jgi:hypothetical protein
MFTLKFYSFRRNYVSKCGHSEIASTLPQMRTNTSLVSYLFLNYCTIFYCVLLINTSHRFQNSCTSQITGTPSECGTVGRNKVNLHCYKNDKPWIWSSCFWQMSSPMTMIITSCSRGVPAEYNDALLKRIMECVMRRNSFSTYTPTCTDTTPRWHLCGHCASFMTSPEWRKRKVSGEWRAWLHWRGWLEGRDFGDVVLKRKTGWKL